MVWAEVGRERVGGTGTLGWDRDRGVTSGSMKRDHRGVRIRRRGGDREAGRGGSGIERGKPGVARRSGLAGWEAGVSDGRLGGQVGDRSWRGR